MAPTSRLPRTVTSAGGFTCRSRNPTTRLRLQTEFGGFGGHGVVDGLPMGIRRIAEIFQCGSAVGPERVRDDVLFALLDGTEFLGDEVAALEDGERDALVVEETCGEADQLNLRDHRLVGDEV
jgi:hypothetical protein